MPVNPNEFPKSLIGAVLVDNLLLELGFDDDDLERCYDREENVAFFHVHRGKDKCVTIGNFPMSEKEVTLWKEANDSFASEEFSSEWDNLADELNFRTCGRNQLIVFLKENGITPPCEMN